MVLGLSVIWGASVSMTVTVKLQLVPVPLPQVTVVVPTGKNDPEAGVQLTVPQLPVTVGAKLTIAPHWPGSFGTVMLAGQLIVQPEFTVTVSIAVLFVVLTSPPPEIVVVLVTDWGASGATFTVSVTGG